MFHIPDMPDYRKRPLGNGLEVEAMFFQDGIQRFLDGIDRKILARGTDYYRSGMVERIDCDGSCVTAEVSGSEEDPYLVEIDFSADGEVEDWSCDCPYEWGPVCKHTAAVLLALQSEAAEKLPREPARRKIDVQKLIEQAGKEQLAALVLEHCREDKRFQSQVLAELEDTGEQELESIKELIRETIRANTHRGYIAEDGCDNICADLDDALDKARRRLQRGQWGRALDITQFVLVTGMKLAEEADSSSGSLSWTIDAALETVGLAASGYAESGGDKEDWVKGLLETALGSVFDGWDQWRYELLRQATVLADSQNEGEFYDALTRLSDRRWESFQDGPGYDEQDKLIRYHIICSAHGVKEARAYLERNLDVDEFRLILVREYIEEGDHANAERLCRERIGKEAPAEPWYRPSQWQYLLYEVYQDWGQREKQIEQARRLALMGDQDFYQTAKDLLAEDGRWMQEYPRFLAELKAGRPAREYMEVLAQENETALLMEQVRLVPEAVFRYGSMLAPQYGEEVYSLCAGVIRQTAKRVQNRKDYKGLCDLLRLLVNFGGKTEAQMLIGELREAYPRRPALWDELEKVEQEGQKKSKHA